MFTQIKNSFIGKSSAILLACSIFCMSFTTANAGNANVVTLKSGTLVMLELISGIKSNKAKSGQMVEFRVINDIKADGVIVIPAGSIAKGQVIEAQKSSILGQPGELRVAIKNVAAIDGTNIPLMASEFSEEGKDKLLVSVIGGLLCIFPFFMTGGNAEMPSGTQIQATVLSSTEIAID